MPVCRDCGTKIPLMGSNEGRCFPCHLENKNREKAVADQAAAMSAAEAAEIDAKAAMVVLSTDAATDLKVAQRIDVISAEFAVGMGLLTDIFNAWRDVFGGRSKSYQNTLKDARRTVLQELRREAHALGADAVLGVKLDYSEISGGGKSMLFLVASGTAVRLAPTH